MEPTDPDRPGVIVFPPVLYATTLACGLFLHWLLPGRLLPVLPARITGAVLLFCGAAVAKWGESAMRRSGTNVDPRKASLAIVAAGPFRFTRNPLYMGLITVYLSITLIFDAIGPLILLPAAILITHFGIVLREERYLERKFGEGYRLYKSRVRRYL